MQLKFFLKHMGIFGKLFTQILNFWGVSSEKYGIVYISHPHLKHIGPVRECVCGLCHYLPFFWYRSPFPKWSRALSPPPSGKVAARGCCSGAKRLSSLSSLLIREKALKSGRLFLLCWQKNVFPWSLFPNVSIQSSLWELTRAVPIC